MLYRARKCISDRCYNGTILNIDAVRHAVLFVHFQGWGVVVVKSACHTPRNPLYTTKEFFQSRFINEYYAFARWRLLCYYDQNPFRIFFSCFLLNLVIPARSKVLICRRKPNPEYSGRSSKMASSCQWPFSSFLLASSLLNSIVSTWTTLALYNLALLLVTT